MQTNPVDKYLQENWDGITIPVCIWVNIPSKYHRLAKFLFWFGMDALAYRVITKKSYLTFGDGKRV